MRLPRLVLLPGMDGTGELFREFFAVLAGEFQINVVSYPVDVCLSDAELVDIVRTAVPKAEPFVLLAESFSTPLAIRYAATNPPNLQGLVLCAGFASSPVCGVTRLLGLLLSPLLARFALPDFAIRDFLIGRNASSTLQTAVRASVLAVRPDVMASRIRFVFACDVRESLRDVCVPMLYIQATRDRLVPRRCMKEIHGIKPEMAAKTVDGPHLILQRAPERAAEIVAEFVRRLI